jgi:NTE family protein
MQSSDTPSPAGQTTPETGYALVLSGGGVRATAFHLGLLLRLAAEARLESVRVISSVSGGSLAAALVFARAGLTWPSSLTFIDSVLPQARKALVEQSLQGSAVRRTMLRPWKLLGSRGNLFAEALEEVWAINGNLKQLAESPRWFINATCYETGRNWRFSQKHIGDWKFGHNFDQDVPIATAIAASAAIPYMVGFVQLEVQPEGWFSIDPATDEPQDPITPMRPSVRLWDGGVYENLGMEPVYKPQRGLVDERVALMIVGDASAYLTNQFGPAGMFSLTYPHIRPPRLFDIATEQTRALRSRILIDAILGGRLAGAIVRLGRSVAYIDRQVRRQRERTPANAFLDDAAVSAAGTYPTNADRMAAKDFTTLLRHGFETTDATLTAYRPQDFPSSILWDEIRSRLPACCA